MEEKATLSEPSPSDDGGRDTPVSSSSRPDSPIPELANGGKVLEKEVVIVDDFKDSKPKTNGTANMNNGKRKSIFVNDPDRELNDEEKAAKKQASFRTLYAFADRVDIELMLLGVLLAVVQAVIPPLVWVFMGNFVSYSIQRELVKNALDKNATIEGMPNITQEHLDKANKEFDEEAQPLSFWMLGLSLVIFVACFLQRLAWEVTGIRQVFRVKRAYVRKLLHMDVSWLESRHSGQVASMLHE